MTNIVGCEAWLLGAHGRVPIARGTIVEEVDVTQNAPWTAVLYRLLITEVKSGSRSLKLGDKFIYGRGAFRLLTPLELLAEVSE